MEEYKSAYPLIHNKVISPRFVTPTLRRPRLLDWLKDHSECRALVIAAGAGYGKTTLLWQFEQTVDFPVFWYKLDRNDRDWTLHISYLVEAVSQLHPGFGRRAHSILRQMGGPGSSRPGVTAFLLAEMHERLKEPCTFIIDDWQYVASVTEVRGLWNQILRDAPPTCRFIFLSRGKPHLQFARFKTHGGYAELRTDDLRLTEAEIEELFRDVYRDPLTPNEVTELDRRTEGWAASLQLVEVSLRERKTPEERQALIESITATTDSDLFTFLAEEVLGQQTADTRDFLLATSILQQINPELAERLAGTHDGTRRLMHFEQAGLFTYRLDESRYRYHGLFREFLERRLADERSEAEVTSLHIHAASYYETTSQWPEAIYHYLRAGLQTQAARIISRYGEEAVGEGRLGLVDQWLQRLPERTIRGNARLSLLQGEALGIRGEFAQAQASLQRAKDFFARKGDGRMQALALLKESSVLNAWGRPDAAFSAAAAGLELAPGDDPLVRLRLEGNIAITSLWLYRPLEDAIQTLVRVTAGATELGQEHYAAIGVHNTGLLQLESGDVAQAIKSLERAAEFWGQLPANPFGDNYNLVRAYLAAGNLRKAFEKARTAEVRTRAWSVPNTEARNGLALCLLWKNDFDAAAELLRATALNSRRVGTAAEFARIHFLEARVLAGVVDAEAERVASLLLQQSRDPRLDTTREAILAMIRHRQGHCEDDCGMKALRLADAWTARGAYLASVSALVEIAPLLFEHARIDAAKQVTNALRTAAMLGFLPGLRPWLRPLQRHAPALALVGNAALLADLVATDPGGWIGVLPSVKLRKLTNDGMDELLAAIERNAQKDTPQVLGEMPDSIFGPLRRKLVQRGAARLLLRTLGSLELRRGGWSGPPIRVLRRRTRSLLGILAAHGTNPVSRDVVLDLLWPDSDPAAAVNSLNQSLFQLRREIDPDYRNGRSPDYVLSTPDWLQLNPELLKLDWVEVLQRAPLLENGGAASRDFASFVAELVVGEFLVEARYEDWALPHRQRIHEALREAILPIAQDVSRAAHDRIRLARATISLDPYDELAHVALARALSDSGRRTAALGLLRAFAKRLSEEFDELPSPELEAATEQLIVKF